MDITAKHPHNLGSGNILIEEEERLKNKIVEFSVRLCLLVRSEVALI